MATSSHASLRPPAAIGSFGVRTVASFREALDARQRSDSLATITTDTGALAPGNRDFTRFTVPAQCVAAAEMSRDLGRRALAWQLALTTIRQTAPEHDTMPANVAVVARACRTRAHITVAATTPDNLADLLMLSLLEQNDTLTRAVVRRQTALAANTAVRETLLTTVVQAYLDMSPARVAAAESTLTQMDALGFTATNHADPLPAHVALLAFASTSFDRVHMRREADRIIALSHAIPLSTIQYHYDPVIAAYQVRMLLAFIDHPDSLPTIAQQAKQDLSRFPPGEEFPPGIPYSPAEAFSYRAASVRGVLEHLQPGGSPSRFSNQLQHRLLTPQSVQAAYWYPRRPAAWPDKAGQASLILYGGTFLLDGCLHNEDFLFRPAGPAPECASLLTYLPQWAAQYGDRLAITLVAHTRGSAVRSVALPPRAEADSIAWFLRTYLKLPVTVAVVEDSVWQFPAPDGRHFWRDTTFYGIVQGHLTDNDALVLLTDPAGQLQWVGRFDPTVLRILLARTLPAAAPASGSATSLQRASLPGPGVPPSPAPRPSGSP